MLISPLGTVTATHAALQSAFLLNCVSVSLLIKLWIDMESLIDVKIAVFLDMI